MSTPSYFNIVSIAVLALGCPGLVTASPWDEHGKIVVHPENPHYLQHEDGTPFWWLGDTAWELIHRASREEVDLYLENRRQLGFNVIQTVVLSEFLKRKQSNYYGAEPIADWDALQPVTLDGYDFWDHLDYIVEAAAQRGLYLGLLPTWGEWVVPRSGHPIFNTEAEAYSYGKFLGSRYKAANNIIWILGGDRHPDERPEGVALWRAMAEGITDGVNGENSLDGKANYRSTFMTHHSFNSSSQWFHEDPWIDFHTWGSYHSEYNDTRSFVIARQDWALPNPKPTLNSEPCYEELPLNYAIPNNGYFTAFDVRVAAYWSVLSGACGHTYGANPIWQFTDASRPESMATLSTWHQALSFDGARHMSHLKALLESRPAQALRPAQELILSGAGRPSQSTVVLRGESHLLAYIPTGNQLTLSLGALSGEKIKASWFDPRTGKSTPIGVFDNQGQRSFEVPGISEELTWLRTGRGCDWVLVLDDASKGFDTP